MILKMFKTYKNKNITISNIFIYSFPIKFFKIFQLLKIQIKIFILKNNLELII